MKYFFSLPNQKNKQTKKKTLKNRDYHFVFFKWGKGAFEKAGELHRVTQMIIKTKIETEIF